MSESFAIGWLPSHGDSCCHRPIIWSILDSCWSMYGRTTARLYRARGETIAGTRFASLAGSTCWDTDVIGVTHPMSLRGKSE